MAPQPDSFDPNQRSSATSGLFGLPHRPEDAAAIIIPVPFDATASFVNGAADGPRAILDASRQVDLFDAQLGSIHEKGIAMLEEDPDVIRWNREAQDHVRSVRDSRETGAEDAAVNIREVNHLCENLNDWLAQQVATHLSNNRVVGTLGGDHGAIFGAIAAHTKQHPHLGILHIDAHADLRHAYEGFTFSHASIMENVLSQLPEVESLVQVGIRDLCQEEMDLITKQEGRVHTFFDIQLAEQRFRGETWHDQVEKIVSRLPESVYVSFDVDGLDPSLCPNTGTPVPGGLSFNQARYLLAQVQRSGRHIVGFDLSEVSPGSERPSLDANVGARLLFILTGLLLESSG